MKLINLKISDIPRSNGVYCVINIINNKKYIGSASGIGMIFERLIKHRSTLLLNKHYNKHFQKAWNKYGKDSFEIEILEVCEKEKCIEREQYYIDLLKPEYNICKIAGSTLGKGHNKETRQKISKSRDMLFSTSKGDITRKRMSISAKNKIVTEETKRKNKIANTDKNNKKCILNEEIVFESIKDAAEYLNISYWAAYSIIKRQSKKHKIQLRIYEN